MLCVLRAFRSQRYRSSLHPRQASEDLSLACLDLGVLSQFPCFTTACWSRVLRRWVSFTENLQCARDCCSEEGPKERTVQASKLGN